MREFICISEQIPCLLYTVVCSLHVWMHNVKDVTKFNQLINNWKFCLMFIHFVIWRYYASGLIDHNGGQLILNNTGIKLIIPEGAISKNKTEVIYIALIETEQYFPQLEEGESFLSPVIMCGPHGLRFKKDVLLVLPHCVAIGERNNTKFRGRNLLLISKRNWYYIFIV